VKIKRWSRHYSYLWKTMEKPRKRKRKWSVNQKRVQESVTRGEGISTPTAPVLRQYLKSN